MSEEVDVLGADHKYDEGPDAENSDNDEEEDSEIDGF
jgi:hypothetical protein